MCEVVNKESGVMAKHLTDKQRKKIIADYVMCGNYSEVGRRNKVNASTVKRIMASDSDAQRKAEQKKEQNTQDMLAFMESRKDQAQSVLDTYLTAMLDPAKISDATLSQIATAFGIITDKFTKTTERSTDTAEDLTPLKDLLK